MAFTFAAFCYIVALILTAFLIFFAVFHVIAFDELKSDYKNPIDQCNSLNPLVLPEYILHFFYTLLFLFALEWFTVILNLPLIGYHIHRYRTRPVMSRPGLYDPTSIMNADQLSRAMKEGWIKLGFYIISFFYYLYGSTRRNQMEQDPEDGEKKPPAKKNARAILESVCSDFENIDLPCPKQKAKSRPRSDFIQFGRPAEVTVEPIRDEGAAVEPVLTLDEASRLVSGLFAGGGGGEVVSSSVAELADAEIVQTGEDCVSIIITNPRFVEVMTGGPEAQSSAETIIDLPRGSLEEEPAVTLPEPRRPAFDKPVVYRPDSNPKARRITAKMRNLWAEELEAKGQLTCPLPGCLQTFETMTNFRTHYKFCAGVSAPSVKPCIKFIF
ncbi:uncharacterized protein LOC129233043 [Uloborus diversus]|uniref:uncharacterized protein LOC129233043 n=1 Tax=Uloborus diversus TaxID=327109 RepID=UPI0024090348|nr:uncharacterized protein LOC129233043 [Uloborus diversus]